MELFERIVLAPCNHIVFLPTGSGKTRMCLPTLSLNSRLWLRLVPVLTRFWKFSSVLCVLLVVSFMYMQYMLRQHVDKHVVFLAMSVALVAQQYLRFLELTGMPREWVGLFYGGKTSSEQSVENYRVIFATPVVYQQMLNAKQCFVHHSSLVVFDEVHHARKNHPYAMLMKNSVMREMPLYRPRVLGMTASPGEGRDLHESLASIESLCSTVDAEITTPTSALAIEELKACSGLSKTIIAVHDQTDADSQLQTLLSEYAKSSLKIALDLESNDRTLNNANNTNGASFNQMSARELQSQRASLVSDLKMVFSLFENGEQAFVTSDPIAPRMMTIVATLEQETPPSNEIIKALLQSVMKTWDAMDELVDLGADSGHDSAMSLGEVYQDAPAPLSSPHSQQRKNAVAHWNAKKQGLAQKLITAYQVRGGAGKVKCLLEYLTTMGPTSKAIVFVQQRSTALKLTQFLKAQIPPSIGVDCIVGKAEMSANGQLSAARRFNEGQFRVLIATSVAEEGIDIQACDLVIRLDGTQTSKSLIQSRGRARSMDSRYVLIVSSEEKDQLELIMKKEQFMLAAVRYRCDPEGLKREGVNIEALFSEYANVANVALATPVAFNALHQWHQQRYLPMPEVTYTENDVAVGARFTATIIVDGKEFKATGGQKQEARYKAATLAWNHLSPEKLPVIPATPLPHPSNANNQARAWGQTGAVQVKQESVLSSSYQSPPPSAPSSGFQNASSSSFSPNPNNAQAGNWTWTSGGFTTATPGSSEQTASLNHYFSPQQQLQQQAQGTTANGAARASISAKLSDAFISASDYQPTQFVASSPQQQPQGPYASSSFSGWQNQGSPNQMQGQQSQLTQQPPTYNHQGQFQMQQQQQYQMQQSQQQMKPSFSEGARTSQSAVVYRPPVSVHPTRLNSANPIGSLQELCQQHGLPVPDYDDLGQDPHSGDFVVVCKMLGLTAHGQGRQKKVAKTKAASAMLMALYQRQQPS